MSSLRLANTVVDYEDRGQGEPVVLVHGSASDRRTWRGVVDELATEFRVIAYSRRYHWPNEPIATGADYPMHEHVDDLERLIDSLDLSPVHLVGHSYGAFVCLRLAIRSPRCVRSLVLDEPPVLPLFASNPPRPTELLRLLVTRPRTAVALISFGARGLGPATKAIRRGDPDQALRRFGTAVLGRERFACLSSERLEQAARNFIEAEFVGSGFDPVAPEEVRGISQPTLLLAGVESPAFFHRVLDRLQELLPNAERTTLADASHIAHEDNLASYVSAVRRFLETSAARQAEAPVRTANSSVARR